MQQSSPLTPHQNVLIELWTVFDDICKRHDIPYQLFAGTALGAVRHQSIIPWDDDLDVVMLRSDYQHFMKIASEELHSGQYYLQVEFSSHWPMFFSKLRKNNTTCLERYHPRDPEMHQGIYIDIFPCDNLSDHSLIRKLQFLSSKIVIAKSLSRRGYLTDSLLKKLFMALCRLLPTAPFQYLTILPGKKNSQWVHTFLGGAKDYSKNIYPRQWFSETVLLPFCHSTAPVTAYYNVLLTQLYGDYMTPLPLDQRDYKTHAELVDTEKSYEAYLDMQKTMAFDMHTRSIR